MGSDRGCGIALLVPAEVVCTDRFRTRRRGYARYHGDGFGADVEFDYYARFHDGS